MEHIEEKLEQILTELRRLRAEQDPPGEIVGTRAACDYLNTLAAPDQKIQRQTLTNYLNAGKVPYLRRGAERGKGREYVFDGRELRDWHRAGRPSVAAWVASEGKPDVFQETGGREK